MELQRISPDYVASSFAPVWGLLGIPSYRCEPCRHKYFSVLPLRRASETVYPSSSPSAH
jgi:hypothetical protein